MTYEKNTQESSKYTPRAESALAFAADEALKCGQNQIGTLDILLGLTRETEGLAVQVLLNLGVKIENVRKEVTAIMPRA